VGGTNLAKSSQRANNLDWKKIRSIYFFTYYIIMHTIALCKITVSICKDVQRNSYSFAGFHY